MLFGYGVTYVALPLNWRFPMEIILILVLTVVALIIFFQAKKSEVVAISNSQLIRLITDDLTLEQVQKDKALIAEIRKL